MIKMRIPIPAVGQKMQMDGLNISELKVRHILITKLIFSHVLT